MFNPHARWDRRLPGDDDQGAENVEVVARFQKGKIIPLYFVLKENRVDISRINYAWLDKKGRERVFYFSVSDKSDNYCLFLDAEAMSWRLVTS
jgi:hypothetical protein